MPEATPAEHIPANPEIGQQWRLKRNPKRTATVTWIGRRGNNIIPHVRVEGEWMSGDYRLIYVDRFREIYEPLPRVDLAKLRAARTLTANHRRGAAKRGIEFDLTMLDVLKMLEESGGRCQVTGILLCGLTTYGGVRRPYAPSIDRINSSYGYTKRNCRVVCVAANLAMNQWGGQGSP